MSGDFLTDEFKKEIKDLIRKTVIDAMDDYFKKQAAVTANLAVKPLASLR